MRSFILAAGFFAALAAPVSAAPVTIVAAENVYGEMAREIAGPAAAVTSVLSNPDQDPHLFESNASTARAIAEAMIVIVNGADYDPWMDKLLAATTARKAAVIVVADLVGKKSGDNPHLWYDPATMRAAAKALGEALALSDPDHKADYAAGVARFVATLVPLDAEIAAVKARFAGAPVTASEPVFGYMATALGLSMRNERFQTAVMNDTEPSPSDVAAFEHDLTSHAVRVMLYNSQADDAAVKRLVGIARQAKVPVVGVTETEPAGKSYAEWMLGEVKAVGDALRGSSS